MWPFESLRASSEEKQGGVNRSRSQLLAMSLSKGHSVLVGERSEKSNFLREDAEKVAGDQFF